MLSLRPIPLFLLLQSLSERRIGDTFYSEGTYHHHLSEQHESSSKINVDKKPKKVSICDECGKVFRNNRNLSKHKEYHQDVSLRTCGICDKVFTNRAETYKHYMSDHSNEPCPIQVDNIYVCECKICSKILATTTALYTHYKLSHKLQGKAMNQYFDGFNGPRNNSEKTIKKNKHRYDRKYKCEKCDKLFIDNGKHKKHIAICMES